MPLLLTLLAIVVVATAITVVAIRRRQQRTNRNADLTQQILDLVDRHRTRTFAPDDIAPLLDITLEEARRLITALPADPDHYLVQYGAIRFWGPNWFEQLIQLLAQEILNHASQKRHHRFTDTDLSYDLHNHSGLIQAALRHLFDQAIDTPDAGLCYQVAPNHRSIIVYGA